MALREILLPWESQPQEAAQLSGAWVDRGLQSLWLPGVLLLPGGSRAAAGGSPTVGELGSASAFNGTNQSIALGRDALSHGRGARIAWMRIGSASGSRNISAGGNAGTGFRVNGTAVEIVNTGVSADLAATAAVSAGELCVLGMSAESFNLRLYKNGVLLASRTDRGTGSASNNLDTLGQTGTGSQYLDGSVFMHASFSGRLSDEDQASLYQNPWQLFEPRRVWVPVIAVGAHDASGSLVASDSVVAGVASRSASHAASGALAAGSSTVAGSANRLIAHAAAGALTATAAAVAGLATRYRTHASAGDLVSGAAVVAGLADVTQVGPSHVAVGDLVAGNAAVSGTANRYKVHAGSGALQADAAVLAGVAVHNVLHAAGGALVAGEAAMTGVAFIGDAPPVVSRLGGFEMGAPEIERKPLLQQILEARAARSAPVAKPAKKKAKAIEIQAAHAVLADRGESQFTALMKQWAAQKPVLSPVVDTTAEAFMAQVKARILEIEQDDEDVLMLLLD